MLCVRRITYALLSGLRSNMPHAGLVQQNSQGYCARISVDQVVMYCGVAIAERGAARHWFIDTPIWPHAVFAPKRQLSISYSCSPRTVGDMYISIRASRATDSFEAQAAQKLVTRELGSFVEVDVAGDVLAKTNTNYNSRREPNWNEAFNLDLCHEVAYIRLRVRSIYPCTSADAAFPS